MEMLTKQETYEYLTARGIRYEVTEHAAVYNMAEVALIDLPHRDRDGKNLFVRDHKRNYYLLTVKGDRRVDLREFRKAQGLGSLRFAPEEDLMDILGLIPGAVTPLGLLNDEERKVTLYLDAALAGGLVGVHPNDNTATVWMQADDLVRLLEEHGNTVRIVSFES